MRLAVFCFLLLRMCGADLSADALVAHHGGVVVGVGDRAVEVVASSDGAVESWVVDGEGTPIVASPDPITLTLTAEGGARTPVVVVWDPLSSSYKAMAPVPIVPGPVDVQIVVAGEPRGGHADTIVVIPMMAAAPSTTVVVETPRPHGRVAFERPSSPSVVVEAPSRPGVVVVAPQPPPPPGVVFLGPPPPPGVVVVAPRPPSPPGVVFVAPRPPPRPGVVVVAPGPPGVVVYGDDRGHHDHGRHLGEYAHGHEDHGHGGHGGHGRH